MRIRGPIYGIYHQLIPAVGLNVYAVAGSRATALIDSGISTMSTQVEGLLAEATRHAGKLDWLLVTHAHEDHIGCNSLVKMKYHAKIAAHREARPWLEDRALHYREFAVFAPDILPEDPISKAGSMRMMGDPASVDIAIQEGTEIYLGDDVVLTALHLPGHKPEELAYFERGSRTLILGDAIVCMDLPFFHGHTDGTAIRKTLQRLPELVRDLGAQQVLMAHYPPLAPPEFVNLVRRAEEHIAAISHAVLESLRDRPRALLRDIFPAVCRRMDKQPEFHSLSAVMAEVEYLERQGVITKDEAGNFVYGGNPPN